MAIKEEHYDPGYEAAFGGAYGEPAPEGGQSNGYCNFSASEETGWYHLWNTKDILKNVLVHTMKVKGGLISILCSNLQLRRHRRIQTRLDRFRTVSG